MSKSTEQDARRRRQRRADLDALKLARGGCEAQLENGERCGWNRLPAGLHWDHIAEKTHGYLAAFKPNWAWSRILAEIELCELVCACCHAVRTAERGYKGGGSARRSLPPLPTHCSRGHAYDKANTFVRPDGGRVCRMCRRARESAREARARERARQARRAAKRGRRTRIVHPPGGLVPYPSDRAAGE